MIMQIQTKQMFDKVEAGLDERMQKTPMEEEKGVKTPMEEEKGVEGEDEGNKTRKECGKLRAISAYCQRLKEGLFVWKKVFLWSF